MKCFDIHRLSLHTRQRRLKPAVFLSQVGRALVELLAELGHQVFETDLYAPARLAAFSALDSACSA